MNNLEETVRREIPKIRGAGEVRASYFRALLNHMRIS